jgi:hypothetical protein
MGQWWAHYKNPFIHSLDVMITMDARQLGGVEGRLGRELGDWKEKKRKGEGEKKIERGEEKK